MSHTVFELEDEARLLAIARRALEARVRRQREPAREDGGVLDTKCGAFVSIHCRDELRGCLGRLEPDWPIARVVAHLGRALADSDPRFPPVIADELAVLSIEISVLRPEREIQSMDEIDVGRHGLIAEAGGRRALLLPQVATAHGWDVQTFVEHTCVKAGLPATTWQQQVRLFVFEALVFSEPLPQL